MLEIIHTPSFAKRTTLRLGGTALAEIRLSEAMDTYFLPEKIQELGGDICILGAGSNILAADGKLPLVMVRPQFTQAPTQVHEEGNTVWVQVGSGVRLAKFLGKCATWGLQGLEGLCGIPGTVGGAIAMNAGSFGHETCAKLHSLCIYSPEKGIEEISAKDIVFGYRKFSITDISSWFLVIHATFILTREERNGIKQRMFHNFLKKKSTQPVKAWSAGCLFKNPSPEKPAGMLLDLCGFKGKGRGGIRFSPIHANFLTNEGTGTATIAFELIAEAREAVRERFSLELETEVKLLCHQG